MYSKDEARRLKEEFWTRYGRRMKKHTSAETGLGINWINYKTSVKNIDFKKNADNKRATISIEINHPDESMRELFYDQFLELKTYLHNVLKEKWNWSQEEYNEFGDKICSISFSIDNINIYDKESWPKLFSFFEKRMVRLDQFWSDAKDTFIDLNS